jgi:hypothetical protein
MWPGLDLSTTLTDQEQNIIFVTSKNPSNVHQYAELCLFLMDASSMNNVVDQDNPEQPSNACKFQAMRMDTKPGWGAGWNRADVQMHDADFLDNKKKFLSHLIELESFAKYRKGKAVERPAPAKSWKPKKSYSNWEMAMTEPQSYLDVLKFRDMMAEQGRRITSITDRQRSHSQAEFPQMARLGVSSVPENGASATSGIPSTSNSTANDLLDQLQSRSDLEGSNPKIIGTVPERYMDEPDNSLETNSRSRKGKSVNMAPKSLEAHDNKRLTEQENGKGISASSPKVSPTLMLRGHIPKRGFDHSDLEIASSSAGPSKRPRQENQLQFESDYLDDEELSLLLENGGFAE